MRRHTYRNFGIVGTVILLELLFAGTARATTICAAGSNTPCAPPIHPLSSNVLFIPGTLTSRLYMKNADGSERELWEPRSDLDVSPLAMNPDGTSVNQIYTRDIVDRLYSNDPLYGLPVAAELKESAETYGPFEKFMNNLVTKGTIKDWRSFPYDWRYDVLDIVKDGTLVGTATSSPSRIYLQDVVQELASTSPTGKVTIIAHSNGGLIAKALAIDLYSKNEGDLIDKMLLIGTPQFGTPKSITDLLHGDEFTQLGGLLMYSNTVRDTEKTMPGAYDLLPSSEYFSNIPNPVITFDSLKPAVSYQQAIGANITSFSQLSDFLTDAFHLNNSVGLPGSPKTPIALSSTLVEKAKVTHAMLDTWMPPAGIQIFAIAGWGQLTPYQTNYTGIDGLTCDRTNFFVPIACSLLPQIRPTVSYTENGDDTVVAESAEGLTANVLFFNSKKYFSDERKTIVHKSLLSASPIQDLIETILMNGTSSNPYFATTMPASSGNSYTVVSAHSPVNLLATDISGNETGIVPVTGLNGMYFEKEEIPGSSVHVIDDEKYLYLPAGNPYSISMLGYDTGTTTIDVENIAGDGSRTLVNEFKDIPTTASTGIVFHIGSDGKTSSTQLPESEEANKIPTSLAPTSSTMNITTPSQATSHLEGTSSRVISIPSISNLVLHLTENVSLHGFARQEAILALITLETVGNYQNMLSTVFVTILPFLHKSE